LVLGRKVLVIKPLTVPVADRLVRGKRVEIPPGSEDEGDSATVADVLLRVILWSDPIEPLEPLDVWFHSEVSSAEGLEVGEHSEAVGANVMQLESIFVQHLREELGGRKRKVTLNPSATYDYVTWLRSRKGFNFEEFEQDLELVWIRVAGKPGPPETISTDYL
jgi:hypothetical protein